MYQLVLNLTKICFFICWLCNKLKKILLFSFEKNSVVGGIRTHAHKSETKWRWENLFSPKKIFSNAIFPHTTHSYTYPTYLKWKILPISFLKSWSEVPACTCSIWIFYLKTAILLHKFSRKWFLCWYPLTSNSNFEQFWGQNFFNFQVLPLGILQTLIWKKKMATKKFFMVAPYPTVHRYFPWKVQAAARLR